MTRAPRADRGGAAGAPERAGRPRQHQKPPYHVPVNRGLEIHGKFELFLGNTRAER
nr:MAG TPA: hypothetical protein [Inoviridae sp.]